MGATPYRSKTPNRAHVPKGSKNLKIYQENKMEELNLSGKKAVVTGAGQGMAFDMLHLETLSRYFFKGIGREVAIKLHDLGVDVYAISRTKKHLDALKFDYPSIHIIEQDVGDWKALRTTVEALPTFELLVNNAGLGDQNLFLDVPEEELDKYEF